MSTRAVIAKRDGDGWKGRYHHWDGYPSGLGVTLVTAKDEFFGGDLDAMIVKLIDNERIGWSTINDADLTAEPGWNEHGTQPRVPQSYTARGETCDDPDGYWITSDGDDGGTEWAYLLTPEGVRVYERRFPDTHGEFPGQHMVGMFGLGNPEAGWADCGLVAWGDAERMMRVGECEERLE